MAQSNKRTSKRTTTTNRKPQKRSNNDDHPLAWIFTGLCLGLVVAAGIYVYFKTSSPHSSHFLGHTRSAEQNRAPAVASHQERSQHGGILPHPVHGGHNPKQAKQSHQSKPRQYLVQVAAFRKYSAANAEKARLALIGLESEIDKHHEQSGHVWYRVRIGPETHTKVKATLKRLSTYHFKGVVVPANG